VLLHWRWQPGVSASGYSRESRRADEIRPVILTIKMEMPIFDYRKGICRIVRWTMIKPLWPILLVVAQMGCSDHQPMMPDPTPTATPMPTATPRPVITSQLVLDSAANNLSNLESSWFTMEHMENGIEVFPGVVINKIHGYLRIPDEYKFTIEAEASGTYLEVNVVNLSGRTYMTNMFTGQWQEVSNEAVPVRLNDLHVKLDDLTNTLQDHELEDSEIVGSENCYVISGSILSDSLAHLIPASQLGSELFIKLWVSQELFLLKRIQIDGRLLPTDIETSVHIISFTDINKPAEISNPLP